MEIECSMLVHEKGIFCHFSGIFVDKPFAYHIDIYRKMKSNVVSILPSFQVSPQSLSSEAKYKSVSNKKMTAQLHNFLLGVLLKYTNAL